MPPGKSNGTWKAKPLTKSLPARPDDGSVVSHSLVTVLNVVVASVAVGENVTEALGTSSVNGVPAAVNWICWASKRTVTGLEPSPAAFKKPGKPMKLFARMGGPV